MTESDWQALLDRDAADAELRLQYSDWLEEQGLLTEAEVQRWLARTNKRPNSTGMDWEWWQEGQIDPGAAPHRILPYALFSLLPGKRRAYRTYDTRRGAEDALVRAWAKLQATGESPL